MANELNTYIIAFLGEDGEVLFQNEYAEGEIVIIPGITKQGWTFDWWVDVDGETYVAGFSFAASKSLTLSPVFSINTYKYYVYHINEITKIALGSEEGEAEYGSTIYSADKLKEFEGYFQTTDDNIVITDIVTDNVMNIYYRPEEMYPLTMPQIEELGYYDLLLPDADIITDMTLANSLLDEIYAAVPNDRRSYDDFDIYTVPTQWDLNTVMKAEYEGDYRAGNIHKTVDDIDSLRLRRMMEGEHLWTVLKDYPVNTVDDLHIVYVDRYENNGETVRYSMVPVFSNSIGASLETSVKSHFEGVAISNANVTYRAFVYDYPNMTRTHSYAAVTTLRSKYPYVFRNAQYNYVSGSLSAGFFPVENLELVTNADRIVEHNEQFIEFLTDRTPKLLKFDDGRSWIVAINDTVTYGTPENGFYTQFTFTQIGDSKSEDDLYDANLIDWEPIGGVT